MIWIRKAPPKTGSFCLAGHQRHGQSEATSWTSNQLHQHLRPLYFYPFHVCIYTCMYTYTYVHTSVHPTLPYHIIPHNVNVGQRRGTRKSKHKEPVTWKLWGLVVRPRGTFKNASGPVVRNHRNTSAPDRGDPTCRDNSPITHHPDYPPSDQGFGPGMAQNFLSIPQPQQHT